MKSHMVLITLFVGLKSYAFAKDLKDCDTPNRMIGQSKDFVAIENALSPGCADAGKVAGICVLIYKKLEAPEDSNYEYLYEKKIFEAACADPLKDSDEIIQKKIQNMWIKLEGELKCDTANFDVSHGSLLKYAVALRNFEFLNKAITEWRVNLNTVDPKDNRTLLDYIEAEIARTKGSVELSEPLITYYKIARRAGARHRREL